MIFRMEIPVQAAPNTVREGFTRSLFEALRPPGIKLRIDRYDGNNPGDSIHLTAGVLFVRFRWESLITAQWEKDGEWGFEDQGVKLPFFLKSWTHRHLVQSMPKGSVIIEDVQYEPRRKWMRFFARILVNLQFHPRPKVYRKYFGNPVQ